MKKKKFTKKQLDLLEKLNYLSDKLQNGGLSEDEYEQHEELLEQCHEFLHPIS